MLDRDRNQPYSLSRRPSLKGKHRYDLRRDDSYGMFEYACHEGNYALVNILRGARAAEAPQRRPVDEVKK